MRRKIILTCLIEYLEILQKGIDNDKAASGQIPRR